VPEREPGRSRVPERDPFSVPVALLAGSARREALSMLTGAWRLIVEAALRVWYWVRPE